MSARKQIMACAPNAPEIDLRFGNSKEAIGHGVRAKRSKSGAISFDLLEVENKRAAH
jgi:hypothetical protein